MIFAQFYWTFLHLFLDLVYNSNIGTNLQISYRSTNLLISKKYVYVNL
jgi:hypothetical protein